MSHLNSVRARRGLAAGVAAVMGASALSLLGATAAQAAPTGALTWGVSEQYFDHLSTRVVDGGVTVDATAKTFTFPEADTTVADGVTTIDYSGSVRAAFAMAGTEYYHVKIADPSVKIAADGIATVSATVSSAAGAQGANPAETVAPVEVDVIALPTTGDLATGYTALPGTDFAPEFFDGVAAGVEAHFKQTGATEQPKKRPAGFTAAGTQAPVIVPATASATKKRTGAGYDVTITGQNFTSTHPAFGGVYVGVAPSGGLPDVSSQGGMGAFLGATYLPPAALANGVLNATTSLATEDLTVGQKYSVYTWMAHSHATTDLDTESVLGVLRSPAVKVSKKVAGTKATLAIKGTDFVGGDANYEGVYVGVAPVGGLPNVSDYDMSKFVASDWVASAAITNGAFNRNLVVDLTKLKAGKKYALYTWQAHKHTTTALDTVTALDIKKPAAIVKKAAKLRVVWGKKPTAKKAGTVKISVKKTAAKVATGKVTVTQKVAKKVKKGKKTITKIVTRKVTKKLVKGATTVAAPKGTRTVTVKYSGDARYKSASKTLRR